MARKKTALLMTVGTGVGNDPERSDKLAHGLLYSIDSSNPDLVVFFGSDNSKQTIDSIIKQYYEKEGDEFDYYEFVNIPKIDSFTDYFQAFKSKILELEDYKIIIDYTSGTKTMTMSAAFASMLFRKKLVFVSGKRENGVVVKGTEKLNTQNLYSFYDDILLVKCKELFNSNRFEAAFALIEDMVATEEKDIYSKLFKAYSAFDNVDYENALKYFDVDLFAEKWPDMKIQLFSNNKSLYGINDESKFKNYYILSSIINNAKRRSLENKYDDAIARLYRSLELIEQIRLEEKYKLNTSNIDVDYLRRRKLNEDYLNYLESLARDSGKIKISLDQGFNLLNELGDELGKTYTDNIKRYRNILSKRNMSILAHGLESKNKEEYEEVYDLVIDFAMKLNPNIESFIKDTEFPKFDI